MKIPKSVHVMGELYTVTYKWNLRDDGGCPCLGLTDVGEKIILIDRSLSKEDKWETFLHELFHAILEEANVTKSEGIDPVSEEIICYAAAKFISSMFNVRWKRGVIE